MKRNTTARLQSADSQTKRFGIEMLTPTMIILIIMTAYPLIFTLIYSFTDYNYLKGTDKASFILFKRLFPSGGTEHHQVYCVGSHSGNGIGPAGGGFHQ